jgi:hypothetical protein
VPENNKGEPVRLKLTASRKSPRGEPHRDIVSWRGRHLSEQVN